MSDPTPLPQIKPRRFRFMRGLAYVAVALVTLAALFYAEENFRARQAWNQYRQEAAARGLKIDYTAFIPEQIPDAENGANTPFIQSWFPKPRPDETNRWPQNYSEASTLLTIKRRTRGGGGQDDRGFKDLTGWQQAFVVRKEPNKKDRINVQRVSHGAELDPTEQATAARAVLDELKVYEPALSELQTMSAHPKVRFPVEYKTDQPFAILLPHLAKLKGIVQVLSLRASAELATGQTNQAFATVKLMLWVSDSMQDETFLISHLVRIATRQIALQSIWEGLARHQWSDAQLQELQDRMLRTDFFAALDRSLQGERAGGLTALEWMQKQKSFAEAMRVFDWSESDNGDAGGTFGKNEFTLNVIGWTAPKGWLRFEMVSYGRLFDDQFQGGWDSAARVAHPSVLSEDDRRMQKQLQARTPVSLVLKHRYFSRLLLPALGRVASRSARAQATASQAALACALERYRLAQGKLPDALSDLVPKYLAQIPNESVSTNAMHYQKTEGGFMLYSIGWDETDDGGAFLGTTKDKNAEHGDWVWRSMP